ncbi:MAG: STAS domain-containing protein, partial [Planctomycetota bacterium]
MAAPAQNTLITEHDDDVDIVQFRHERLVDPMVVQGIGRELEDLIATRSQPKLIIDFGGVTHAASMMLTVLVTAHKHVLERSGTIRLTGIEGSFREILAVTKLDRAFDIRASREA